MVREGKPRVKLDFSVELRTTRSKLLGQLYRKHFVYISNESFVVKRKVKRISIILTLYRQSADRFI